MYWPLWLGGACNETGRTMVYHRDHLEILKMSPLMRKPAFCICENKGANQLHGNLQFLLFLNPKFQASINLLWLYSPVCVRPGLKSQRQVCHDAAEVMGKNKFAYNNFPRHVLLDRSYPDLL